MRETFEFRIPERHAVRFLESGLGVTLPGGSVRKVVLPGNDHRVQQIGQLERRFEEELQAAEWLHLVIRAHFEPTGAVCGTEYDDSLACKHCGAGARQISDHILNTRRIPKGKDIAQTIAGEIVVSPRVVQVCREKELQGAELRPVLHQGRRGQEPTEWSQLVITSKPLKLSQRTVTGNHPFNLDEENRHRCPKGHVAGLNQISELYVHRSSWDGSHWCRTDKLFGMREGELRPEPRLLIFRPASVRGLSPCCAYVRDELASGGEDGDGTSNGRNVGEGGRAWRADSFIEKRRSHPEPHGGTDKKIYASLRKLRPNFDL
jgi:hypothetical protein